MCFCISHSNGSRISRVTAHAYLCTCVCASAGYCCVEPLDTVLCMMGEKKSNSSFACAPSFVVVFVRGRLASVLFSWMRRELLHQKNLLEKPPTPVASQIYLGTWASQIADSRSRNDGGGC